MTYAAGRTASILCGLCLLATISTADLSPAWASENGLNHYPTGVQTVYDGILPSPGDLEFYSYTQYYNAGALKGTGGRNLVPNFRADIEANALRFVYTYPVRLGNFQFSSGIIVPPVREHISIGPFRDRATGFGDIDIDPFYIDWHNNARTVFLYFGTDDWVPSGSYDKNRIANLGNNYWTIGPDFFLTWFPNRNLESSTALVGEVNTTNHATRYHSGDALNIDQSFHWRPFQAVPKLRLAVQGYWHQQIQDDTVSGKVYENGFRGRAFGVGPQIEYDLFKRGGILIKWEHEFLVQNRPQGDRYWFEIAFPL